MRYKGWRILAFVKMPRAFNLRDVPITHGKNVYGTEVKFKPALKVSDYQPYMYYADKGEDNLDAYSIAGLKKQIDNFMDEKS